MYFLDCQIPILEHRAQFLEARIYFLVCEIYLFKNVKFTFFGIFNLLP